MGKTIEATFNGAMLRPDEPIELTPNTRVRITIEEVVPTSGNPTSFLDTALSLQLDGPSDWSSHLDRYLYGNGTDDAR